MKMKVGNKLFSTREERKLTQNEMADLLGLSSSAYSRLERNQVSVEVEQIVNFAKVLDIPLQDFLPETLTITNSHNDNAQVGFIIGNYYSYGSEANEKLANENEVLREKNEMLQSKIKDLEQIIELMKK
jgi:transcriptional regulator with XRE-family HTH domain